MCEIAKWSLPVLGRGPDQPSLDLLEQKLALATSYLGVLDLVLGPLSKTRAKVIFELVDSGLVVAMHRFEQDRIDGCELKSTLSGNLIRLCQITN